MSYIALHCIIGKIFVQILTTFGEKLYEKAIQINPKWLLR